SGARVVTARSSWGTTWKSPRAPASCVPSREPRSGASRTRSGEARTRAAHQKKPTIHKQIYMGIGSRGGPNRPSPMFVANVDCVGCHLVPKTAESTVAFLGHTFQASEAACLGCPGPAYKGVMG